MMPCWVVDPTGYSDHQQPPRLFGLTGTAGTQHHEVAAARQEWQQG